MSEQMKVIFEKTIGGITRVINATTPVGDQGTYVIALVGVGNPYWLWPSIPPGRVIGAVFDGAPICDADSVVNNTNIAAITAAPADVLTYAP